MEELAESCRGLLVCCCPDLVEWRWRLKWCVELVIPARYDRRPRSLRDDKVGLVGFVVYSVSKSRRAEELL